ncbi:MAG: hypothetical protein A2Y98_03470 [Candidatus Portnoybacteria bacterium RBG_19FT_COMBO_36_7]|uniref:TVP38/TMEM64 family membrane protein n=1 Tax=Candidatus Portnoybacteria bacterium RBG_19FT_COMBO_36_7 TaxID=1801992 RepID=A0A1G2F8F3_9BACT|nr:MAG: hypothetical protein A2Y98_03470 [Candidatus Portnoybacteria bacterium RBG_19FT_COMBO_36_7]
MPPPAAVEVDILGMLFKRLRTSDIIIFAAFIVIFIAASFFANKYGHALQELVLLKGATGMLIYVILLIVAELIAPVSFLPLLPLATSLWGSFATAVLSITGWMIGAIIAFFLARRYGRSLINKLVNLERLNEIASAIPEKQLFWGIVLFRIIFPVDILSYALGLFSKIKPKPYMLASLLGIGPFAFILSYGVTLPINYQIIIAAAILVAAFVLYKPARRQVMSWFKK